LPWTQITQLLTQAKNPKSTKRINRRKY